MDQLLFTAAFPHALSVQLTCAASIDMSDKKYPSPEEVLLVEQSTKNICGIISA